MAAMTRFTPGTSRASALARSVPRVGSVTCARFVRVSCQGKSVEERLGVTLPDEMMKVILGEKDSSAKLDNYEESLHSWWVEYAQRKNNESEEHVSDGLLYDDRTHLPRTVAPPPCVERIEIYRRTLASMGSMSSLGSMGSIDLAIDHKRSA